MEIQVTFRKVEADESIRERIFDKVGSLDRFSETIQSAHIILSAGQKRHFNMEVVTEEEM